MHFQPMPLSKLPIGKKGIVNSIELTGLLRRRLLDLGVVPNSIIEVIRVSPVGDPTAYLIKGSLIGLRKSEANEIFVQPVN